MNSVGSILASVGAVAIWAIAFILYALTITWAYNDARSRGKPGCLVALMVFLLWPVGLLLWLIFRPHELHHPSEE